MLNFSILFFAVKNAVFLNANDLSGWSSTYKGLHFLVLHDVSWRRKRLALCVCGDNAEQEAVPVAVVGWTGHGA